MAMMQIYFLNSNADPDAHCTALLKDINDTKKVCLLRTVLACTDSVILQISPWKGIFQHNHFSLLIRGPGGLVS